MVTKTDKMIKKVFFFCTCFIFALKLTGQDVSLFKQWIGNYDFTFVGNTMNREENNPANYLITNTSSSAELNLSPTDSIVAAYLYWAGSGDGDFNILLNSEAITPDRTFSQVNVFPDLRLTYFSAYKDVTTYLQTTKNGTYTLSEFDISPFELDHFQRKTNFAGWAILVVYENPSLPLNQINIYDGLQGVPSSLSINLDNLNILDVSGATAGFIAWEGDLNLATESFLINGQLVGNALNPVNNVFNGTNSVTGSSQLYNMDLDIYNIENYIAVGQTNMTVELTSFQDFIMINTVVTKVNSRLPDASIILNNYTTECDANSIQLTYTIYNLNSNDILPAGTTVDFLIEQNVIASTVTQQDILVGEHETGNITINIPLETPDFFQLTAVVDAANVVTELLENNNSFNINVQQLFSPSFNQLNDLISCNLGFTRAIFDFSEYETLVTSNPDVTVSFFKSLTDLESDSNEIFNTFNFEATSTPMDVFVRLTNNLGCFSITSFKLLTSNCPPVIYNAVTPNADTKNDSFFIDGLQDIFINFRLEIYNRWGKLLWVGTNSEPQWNGYVKQGIGSKKAPEGTYFYVLYLNEVEYPKPLTGYLYLTY